MVNIISQNKLIIFIVGIASIVGCVIVILVSRFQFDRLILHFSCTMTYGITTIIVAFSSSKVTYCLMIVLTTHRKIYKVILFFKAVMLFHGCSYLNIYIKFMEAAGARTLISGNTQMIG